MIKTPARKLNRSLRSSKKSERKSKRLSKIQKDGLQVDGRVEDEKIEPVASSSPKNERNIDSEDEQCIKIAKENLEAIKKDVSRQARLLRFKIGNETLQLPFTKQLFAKCCHEVYHKSLDKAADSSSRTNSGLSTVSFNVAASSTKNTFYNQEKLPFNDITNLKQNVSQNHLRRTSVKKEVTFSESSTSDVPRTRLLRSSKVAGNDLTLGESSIQNSKYDSFKTPHIKKPGSRQVAMVTPGPEVNNPLSVLRRPVAGELAVSLFGSPLLVAPDCAPTSMPQINLPTADGKVVAILPREGFRVNDVPNISTPTRSQLRTLNKYLSDMCHYQPK